MKVIENERLEGERSLFSESMLDIRNTVFGFGESPLKHSSSIRLEGVVFEWKYPLWYAKNIAAKNTRLTESARSGIWYTDGISMTDCEIIAPKTFRRSSNIILRSVKMPNALESLWNCNNVTLLNVSVKGDYFGMGCVGVSADGFNIEGNYLFDGGMNITVRNSRLISKDAFWNCRNVTVYDSYIEGEYLGWNSENLRFVNCTIESHQGMCYMDGAIFENCKIVNSDLCFEYSSVVGDIHSTVDSIKNPKEANITVEGVGELILDEKYIDPELSRIVVRKNEN